LGGPWGRASPGNFPQEEPPKALKNAKNTQPFIDEDLRGGLIQIEYRNLQGRLAAKYLVGGYLYCFLPVPFPLESN
jgi:hypothetical protein